MRQFKEEGLRIVDKRGLPFEQEEERMEAFWVSQIEEDEFLFFLDEAEITDLEKQIIAQQYIDKYGLAIPNPYKYKPHLKDL